MDADTVRRIGQLSRLELSDADIATLQPQMAEVLDFFDKLQQLDTDAVEPMAHAVELTNVLAADTPRESLPTDAALTNAPQREGDYYKVSKVL
ncbi:MAG: Asp-tRNA(Asn)/Glu-tRNA(Gln) amidotransferase subunit GatC [Phycisphaerales bacterium]|nr:Asp-tRNA(Asn)/Glu-tRNA(Gln) amidotransferase subunit GatC [Phycisphaerales bacterium]MBT7170206.1 Asp-tRNA(Asn)/Glu-tRNA(Gln) amidotransferase subunit GatC [Phycisphaerales bacterium]